HQLPLGSQRDHIDPINAVENVELVSFASSRRDLLVRADREDAKVSGWFGACFLPGLDHLANRSGRNNLDFVYGNPAGRFAFLAAVARDYGRVAQFAQHLVALDYFAERGVVAVQELRVPQTNEELAAG